jgi:RNA polymerase sigma factor (sigma-70 family)
MANAQLDDAPGQVHGFREPQTPEDHHSDSRLLQSFTSTHDERAFAALVQRHGPMVLGVCRRVLNDWHDAEDAFQATFLVLARKADSLTRPELLGHWLYGVAYRTAVKARARAARRRESERQAALMPTVAVCSQAGVDCTAPELRAELDEELDRLPERFRTPLVLCYLEGKTNEEAARLLGVPPGSMSTLLSRGRERLRERLSHRGLACPAVALAAMLPPPAALVSSTLVQSTAQAAAVFAAGAPAAGGISASVAALTEEVLKAMSSGGSRRLAALLLTLLIGLGAGGVAYAAVYTGQWPQQKASGSGGSAPSGCCGQGSAAGGP